MPHEIKDGEAAVIETDLEDLFTQRYIEGSEYLADYHERSFEDKRFAAGHQWDKDDIERAEKVRFPNLTLDQTGGVIRAIASSEITTRHEHKYFPRSPEDQDLADKVTAVSRYVRQQAGAEYEDSDAFRDMVTCGMGVAEWYFDETVGESGRLQIVRHPIEDFIWDPEATKKNLGDATWVIRGKWITTDEFRALFPEAKYPEAVSGDIGNFAMWGRGSKTIVRPIRYTGPPSRSTGFYMPKKDLVLVFEMQDYYTVTEWHVTDMKTGEEFILDHEAYKELKKIHREQEIGAPLGTPRAKRVYRKSVFAGTNLLRTEELPTNCFTYLFMTCFEDVTDDGMFWYGMVRPLRDPQKVANVGYSQVFHILGTNPKGALLHEANVFEDEEEAEINWARPDGRITVRPGALAEKRLEVVKASYPSEFERLMTVSLNAVPRIAGVDPFFMGQVPGGDLRRVSGTALSQVTQQGQMMLSIPFDSLRKYRQKTGELLLELMKIYLPDEDMIRVIGDTTGPGPQFVQWMREEVEDVSFDIVVGEAPISTTAQEETWNVIMQHGNIETMAQLGMIDGDILTDLWPNLPADTREKMRTKVAEFKQMQQAAAAQAAGQQQLPPQQ